MKNILNYSKYLVSASLFIILSGVYIIFTYGFNVSIEYTGGTVIEIQKEGIDIYRETINIKQFLEENNVGLKSISESTEYLVIKISETDTIKILDLKKEIESKFPNLIIKNFETIGSTYGTEFIKNSVLAVTLSLLGILVFVTYSFWNLPFKNLSFYFGVSSLVALFHDVLLVISTFSILGYYYGVEIDGLFLTALLTVIGFSINDTIVVFDRIRENLIKFKGDMTIEDIATKAIYETLNRSLATSFVVVFIMFSLYLLGGESIRYFSLALVVGIAAGTYSSIFVATPLVLFLHNKFNKLK